MRRIRTRMTLIITPKHAPQTRTQPTRRRSDRNAESFCFFFSFSGSVEVEAVLSEAWGRLKLVCQVARSADHEENLSKRTALCYKLDIVQVKIRVKGATLTNLHFLIRHARTRRDRSLSSAGSIQHQTHPWTADSPCTSSLRTSACGRPARPRCLHASIGQTGHQRTKASAESGGQLGVRGRCRGLAAPC